jgi:hypothetical protein
MVLGEMEGVQFGAGFVRGGGDGPAVVVLKTASEMMRSGGRDGTDFGLDCSALPSRMVSPGNVSLLLRWKR